MLLEIHKTRIGADIMVVKIAGQITHGNLCQQVEWTVEELIRDNEKKIIFDLSELNRVDSAGVGILVMCSSKLQRAGGELRLAGAHGMVDEVLRLTNVNKILSLHPTPEAAADTFSGGSSLGQPA